MQLYEAVNQMLKGKRVKNNICGDGCYCFWDGKGFMYHVSEGYNEQLMAIFDGMDWEFFNEKTYTRDEALTMMMDGHFMVPTDENFTGKYCYYEILATRYPFRVMFNSDIDGQMDDAFSAKEWIEYDD